MDGSDFSETLYHQANLKDGTLRQITPDEDQVPDDHHDYGYSKILQHGVTVAGPTQTCLCPSGGATVVIATGPTTHSRTTVGATTCRGTSPP